MSRPEKRSKQTIFEGTHASFVKSIVCHDDTVRTNEFIYIQITFSLVASSFLQKCRGSKKACDRKQNMFHASTSPCQQWQTDNHIQKNDTNRDFYFTCSFAAASILKQDGSLVQRFVWLLQQLLPLSGHLHCAVLHRGEKCSGGRKQHGRHVVVLPTDRPCRDVPGRQSTSENPRGERN